MAEQSSAEDHVISLPWKRKVIESGHLVPNAQPTYPPCKGKNCGATDGISHSPECFAEHEATVNPGGKYDAQPTPSTLRDRLISAAALAVAAERRGIYKNAAWVADEILSEDTNETTLTQDELKMFSAPAQPTPKTDAFSKGMYDSAMAATADLPGYGGQDISPEQAYSEALDFARELERALAQCQAELAAAKSDTCIHSVTDPTCLACAKRNLAAAPLPEFVAMLQSQVALLKSELGETWTLVEAERAAREAAEQQIKMDTECIERIRSSAEAAESRLATVEAKLDAVMLEYCPGEMTPEQVANWEAHQRPATAEETATIEAALAAKEGKS